ncbi:hypothetical protein A2957_00490 [Candidatus Roizmanbacteria bacterium RIFCSPLOWO2_01_FULL_38_11]|uniref:Mandelate racemase/muconate lactonizing enzyme C-terminal domain-containing protein n=1 Tax=Candidatus Roizmanbacteria bacterium RIFCSPLOWO2_01_FULL_38_11 TaxID=1802060 RepID=A0A1F7IKK4_9BACT|nr:MAG: hypothetical protein A2957_00490 [Candidatus Roizmanbacteria bacterium RIFCSPLOWO2_01_FULL_38_11]
MSQIKKVVIAERKLHFKESFKISYEEVNDVDIIFVKITDNKGHIGVGSASADNFVTGENYKAGYTLVKKLLHPEFFSYPISYWYKYHLKIQREFKGYPSIQSAIEEALLNLFCSQKNISLSHLFGGYRSSVETMITIPIKSYKKTLIDFEEKIKQGFKIIKIKCGIDPKEDIKKINGMREKIRNKRLSLLLDANQGYSVKETENIMSQVGSSHIKIFEQPIAANDYEGLSYLKKLKKIPIVADESIVDFADAYKLLLTDIVDGVNIKINKCGGPINFIKIFNLASQLRKITMIGCNYESNISITTGATLACGLPIDYVDLDSGHLDFDDDPCIGGAIVKNGKIYVPDLGRVDFI